ncbi:MAG: protein translocase subunit SecD [Bdellovibrionales bacterium]
MIESMRVRTVLFFLFLLFCVIYLLPSITKLPESWWFNRKPLNYGLDIQGGAHLVYGVDVRGVLAERTERTARTLAGELKENGVNVESVAPNEERTAVVIRTQNEADREKAAEYLKNYYGTTLQIVRSEGKEVEARYFDAFLETHREQVIGQAIEVIRNRIDEFGVAEPVIAAQGADRILVQLPGITDAARAKELINRTARLTFRLVDTSMSSEQLEKMIAEIEKEGGFALGKDGLTYQQYVKKVNEALKGKLPENTMVAFEKAANAVSIEAGKIPLLLRTDQTVSGDMLEDAFVSPGEYGEPKVNFRFNSEGRNAFGKLTGDNVGRNLAIVLDEVVYSAPNIKERIEGQGQISLGARNYEAAMKEGNLIATALRAGALPAALQQLEERSVGPSLGADSVQKGQAAGLIGFALLAVFIIYWYRLFGVMATVTLGLNVLGLLAILAALGATLTLPGIAGIALTVGMAVDANVIIYERIKEELARGTGMTAAIRDGFSNAFSSIFDSNVTTAVAAAVLVYFGSGPVRGFGVTLIAGIITTMITAVFISRYLLDLLVRYSKPSKLWI